MEFLRIDFGKGGGGYRVMGFMEGKGLWREVGR